MEAGPKLLKGPPTSIRTYRKMLTEWVVIVFDKPNTDRTAIRPTHVAGIPSAINLGKVKSVGAIYHDVEKTKFAGSTYHILADSKDEIIDFLRKDPYYEAGIWDTDSVIAYPMGVACRLPKKLDGVKESFFEN